MKKFTKKALLGSLILILACITATGGYWLWFTIRSQPKNETKVLYDGVTYIRERRTSPRHIIIHIIKVDLRAKGIDILVTPGDLNAEQPYRAMTTGSFLDKYNLKVAINGDSFTPWHSYSILDYYPHSGDPVTPTGFSASQGTVLSEGSGNEPTLFISPTNQAKIGSQIGRIYNAISGNLLIVKAGKIVNGLESSIAPRSAVALSKSERELLLFVIDGRQPGYSEGVSLTEFAEIIIDQGGYHAINLDGGGSSTLVSEGLLGRPTVLNSPINSGIPGLQRPVANHIGIFANEPGSE